MESAASRAGQVRGNFKGKGLQMAGAGQLPEGKGMGLGLARIITSVGSMT